MRLKTISIIFLSILILFQNNSCKKNDPEPLKQGKSNNKLLSLKFNNEVADSSGNNNIMISTNISFTNDFIGNFKSAAYFDGLNSSIISLDNDLYDLKYSFTFSMWIKPETTSAYLIQKQMDYNGGGPFSFDYFPGKLRILLYFSSTDYFLLEGKSQIIPNIWQYVAATWDGDSVRLYYNGELDNESVLTKKTILDSLKPLGIGLYQWNPNGFRFKGTLDNLEIYNIALSKSDIESKFDKYN